MSESRARFLHAIAAELPVDRIVELHLFPPMRQGGVETGIAIVAATPDAVPPEGASPASASDASPEPHASASPPADDSAAPPAGDPGPPPADAAASPSADAAASPSADAVPPGLADAAPQPPAAVSPGERHTVLTARYRLTQKGPDRGKWEFSMIAEAEAPLVTVDAVVRGVQRRSADAADPERLSTEGLAAALHEPAWATSPR